MIELRVPGERSLHGARIPGILHQTYPTAELPAGLQAVVDQNLRLLPGWAYRRYDDADIERFIAQHHGPALLRAYRSLAPEYGAARADFFRYLLIHTCGGVYLDIKAAVTRPLDSVLRADDECLLGLWRDCGEPAYEAWGRHPELDAVGGEFQQWFLIARPGHPYFQRVIQAMLRRMRWYLPTLHGVGKHGVVRTTGPVVFTQAIHPVLGQWPHRRIRSGTDLGLKYSGFAARDSHFTAFKQHYTALGGPVVQTGPVLRAVDAALAAGARLGRSIQPR